MRTTRRHALSLTAAALGVAMVATACGSGTPGQEAPEDDGNGEAAGAVTLDMWQTQFTDQENELVQGRGRGVQQLAGRDSDQAHHGAR